MDTKIKMIYLADIPDMNLFAASERWVLKYHSKETKQWIGPYLHSYYSYLAVPYPPETAELLPKIGYYNWRLTGHVYNAVPPNPAKMWMMTKATPHPRNTMGDALATIYGDLRTAKDLKYHPPVCVYVPFYPTEDFKGAGLDSDAQPIIRWVTVLRYPDGCDIEEADRWYTDVHAPEICQQKNLLRFFSYKCMTPEGFPEKQAHRVSEMWYCNHGSWAEEFSKMQGTLTPPPFEHSGSYPFFCPYDGISSIFILERPSNNYMKDDGEYYPLS